MSHCVKHNCECIVHKKRPEGGGLSVNAAGNCCQAWSIAGKRAGHAHESQLTFLIWTAVRQQLASRGAESLFFQECTPGFDAAGMISRPLSSSHKVVHVTIGPRLLGWPANRDRELSAGLSLQELVWLGPSSQDEIQQEFESLFGRSCCLTGRVFFQAPEDEMKRWIAAKMQKMGRVAQDVPVSGPGMFQQVLTPHQLQRLEAYSRLQPERASLHDGTFIADLDHWPDSGGPSCGARFPTLLTRGTIVDLGSGRLALSMDRFLSLGFHTYASLSQEYHWPGTEFVKTLPNRQCHLLSGNSQSVPAILAWYLYVFANTARREPMRFFHTLRSNDFADPPPSEEAESGETVDAAL